MSVKEILLPSSGRIIRMKPLNGTKLVLKGQRLYPPPVPKWQEVNYGTEKKPDMRGEYNYASPEYLAQKEAYAIFQAQWLKEPSNAIGIYVDSIILNDEERKEIELWIKENGNPDNLSFKQIFFEEIACLSQEDIEAINEANRPPSPEEVRALENNFQD